MIPPSSFSPATPSAPDRWAGAAARPGPETGSGGPPPPTPPAATPGPPIPVSRAREGVEPETPAHCRSSKRTNAPPGPHPLAAPLGVGIGTGGSGARQRALPRPPLRLVIARDSPAMDVETAIRTRRTHKAFGPEPLDREELEALLELARWAPNHHLTAPWRFRVLGPRVPRRAEGGGRPRGARPSSTGRRPWSSSPPCSRATPSRTRRTCTRPRSPPTSSSSPPMPAASPATGGRPEVLRSEEGRRAVGLGDGERFVGLLHLGSPRQEKAPPERPPVDQVTEFLS